jgi:hypothetical protein
LDIRHQSLESLIGERKRGVRILAKSIYRELASQGYAEKEIVALAGELISEVTTRLADRPGG